MECTNELLKIVIPGNAISKKNSKKTSLYYKDKRTGRLRELSKPMTYYSKPYTEWVKSAIQACAVAKTKHPHLQFPLTGRYIVKMLFFFNKQMKVDLSNLYEGIQDVMTGHNSGVARAIPTSAYHLLEDDSVRFILGHDGSRFLLDPANPRTEVYIIPFSL